MKRILLALKVFLMLGDVVNSESKEVSKVINKEGNEAGRYLMAVIQATERSSSSIFFLDTKEGHIWSYYMVNSPDNINVGKPYLAYITKLRIAPPRVNLLEK